MRNSTPSYRWIRRFRSGLDYPLCSNLVSALTDAYAIPMYRLGATPSSAAFAANAGYKERRRGDIYADLFRRSGGVPDPWEVER